MAKSKDQIRVRVSMKEHLCRIQLCAMKRLFVDEASHANILSAKYVLEDEISGLEDFANRRSC